MNWIMEVSKLISDRAGVRGQSHEFPSPMYFLPDLRFTQVTCGLYNYCQHLDTLQFNQQPNEGYTREEV